MLRNNLKLAFRLLIKNRAYSLISVSGIALGLACCLLIGLYIQHELSYDRYHVNKKRLYRLVNHVSGASYTNGIAKVSGPWGPEAEISIPEVEKICRFVFFGQSLFQKGEQQAYERNGFFADSSALTMFSWPLKEGDPRSALTEPNTIVLTQAMAERYFGEENPIGQTITVDRQTEYRITGLLEDIPQNSHFTFEFLASMTSYSHPDMHDWVRWNQFYTYFLLQAGASTEEVANKMDQLLAQHLEEDVSEAYTPFLQPLSSIHLYSKLHREMAANSDVNYIFIFGLIALMILVIACLNVINLATARAAQRAKEIGVRKVNGASRRSLALQFLNESFLMTVIAVIPAVAIAELMIKPLNTFLGLRLSFDWMNNYLLLGGVLLLILLIGLLSGGYPAFVLSSFQPQRVIKGQSVSLGQTFLRKGLTIFQFSAAIFLLIGTLVVGGQLKYIQDKNLGFNKEQLLVIPLQAETRSKIPAIKEELAQIPGVIRVSASANRPGGSDFGVPYQAVGLAENEQPAMRCLVVDHDFLDTYEMEIADGRGFQKEMALDSSAYLINEAAARQLGWENPVGRQLAMPAIGREAAPIIGVVKDFHFRSMHDPISPLYFFIQPDWFSQISIRMDGEKTQETLAAIENQWRRFEPAFPFRYSFFDQTYDNLYRSESRVGVMMRWFTILAILITCLGLFGLATFITERRTKEIGIRKILGASAPAILGLLSKDVLKLVLLSLIIAAPLAWLAANRWLEAYAYRSAIKWWYFVIAGALAILIAFFTISYQSIRAALANPVESLRYE